MAHEVEADLHDQGDPVLRRHEAARHAGRHRHPQGDLVARVEGVDAAPLVQGRHGLDVGEPGHPHQRDRVTRRRRDERDVDARVADERQQGLRPRALDRREGHRAADPERRAVAPSQVEHVVPGVVGDVGRGDREQLAQHLLDVAASLQHLVDGVQVARRGVEVRVAVGTRHRHLGAPRLGEQARERQLGPAVVALDDELVGHRRPRREHLHRDDVHVRVAAGLRHPTEQPRPVRERRPHPPPHVRTSWCQDGGALLLVRVRRVSRG